MDYDALSSSLAAIFFSPPHLLFVTVPNLQCVYYPVFFAFTGHIQGLSPRESLVRARQYFLRCWRRNLMFWIPTQMVLFGVVSDNWQIPFACLMGVLWSAILSLTAGKTTKVVSSAAGTKH
jgi:Mpv17 / PMP22 family